MTKQHTAFALAMIALLCGFRLHPEGTAAQTVRPRLVLISIDGLMPSAYLSPDSPAPTLRRLASQGAFASGVTGVWPTNTRPSHATLLTGVVPAVHGIVDNEPLDPEQRLDTTFNWFARDIKATTLVGAARAAGLSTAVVMWPLAVGAEADYVVPTFNWQSYPRDLNLMRALSTRGLLDDFERKVAPFAWPPTDRQRGELAAFIAREHRPDVLLLYWGIYDAFAHTYGPDSPMTTGALADVDRLVDRFLRSLEAAGLLDNTFIAVVSDHGYVSVKQGVSPNAPLKAAGLIQVDGGGRITDWQAFSHGTGGTSLIYMKDRIDVKVRARVKDVLDALARNPDAGVERVHDRDELREVGADPAASFGLAMRPGYTLTEETGALLVPPYIEAMHGYPPTLAAMNASLIVTGPGLAGVGDVGQVRLTQVAPTLARLLGVSLSAQADAPIGAIVNRR